MKVLIIGSGGFIARHLIKRLDSCGIDVREASSSNGTGINPYSGLLPNEFVVPRGASAVVYMAQSPRYRDPNQACHVLSVNMLSAVRAAISARLSGVSRFIYLSTGTVYAPSFDPLPEDAPIQASDWYTLSKIQGEQALQMFRNDMEIQIVRPFGVYGENQRGRLIPNLIEAIKANQPITLQGRKDDPADSGGLRISLCHIDDASRILSQLITKGGPSYLNLASDQAASIRTISLLLGELLGKAPMLKTADTFRNTDLVADISKLRYEYSKEFISLRVGLATLVNAMEHNKC